MFGYIFKKIFGSRNERFLRRLRPIVAKINALEPEMQALSDTDFPARIAHLKDAVQTGACALLRGLRAVSDFDYEFQLALMNRRLLEVRPTRKPH